MPWRPELKALPTLLLVPVVYHNNRNLRHACLRPTPAVGCHQHIARPHLFTGSRSRNSRPYGLHCLRCLSSLDGLTVSMNLLILDFSLIPNSHYSEFFLSGKSLRAIWVSKVRAMIPGERYAGVSRASSHDALNNQLAYHLASVTDLMASGPEGHFCDTTSPQGRPAHPELRTFDGTQALGSRPLHRVKSPTEKKQDQNGSGVTGLRV